MLAGALALLANSSCSSGARPPLSPAAPPAPVSALAVTSADAAAGLLRGIPERTRAAGSARFRDAMEVVLAVDPAFAARSGAAPLSRILARQTIGAYVTTGIYELSGRRAELRLDYVQEGQEERLEDAIIDWPKTYSRQAPEAPEAPEACPECKASTIASSPWQLIDAEALRRRAPRDRPDLLAALAPLSQPSSIDASLTLTFLEAVRPAGELEAAPGGGAIVRTALDVGAALRVARAREAHFPGESADDDPTAALLAAIHEPVVAAVLDIDDQGRLRRLRFSIFDPMEDDEVLDLLDPDAPDDPLTLAAELSRTSGIRLATRYDFDHTLFDLGVRVEIVPPPPGDVIDLLP